jgi:uncharacterized protein YbjQ (UPF0145 family)
VSAELPAAAQARMAQLRSSGTWGSALSADEFAAIRSVGFEPVGQVFGAAVYDAGAVGGYGCPGAPGSSFGDESLPPPASPPPGDGSAAPPPSAPPPSATQVSATPASGGGSPPRPPTQVSGAGDAGSFGPLVQAMDQARHTAIARMAAECAELGGHGVVGVHVSRGAFPLGGTQFAVIGTAVRAPDAASGAASGQGAPFTSDVSGQDFAKLIAAGWVPVGLALGISIGSRHDDRGTARQARWFAGNAEVAAWTDLVGQTRQDARRQLESDVKRLGAEGVVIAAMPMRVRVRDCPAVVGRRDHIVEASLIGTAVTAFSRTGQRADGPPLTIMSLDPQRRQAARIRI